MEKIGELFLLLCVVLAVVMGIPHCMAKVKASQAKCFMDTKSPECWKGM
jgi:hypothetical protein